MEYIQINRIYRERYIYIYLVYDYHHPYWVLCHCT